jgi:hypothetical protein
MINGLSLEYTQARIGARLAQRPDERLWQQVRSARSVAALLETVRASVAAPTVSGIPVTGDGDAIELNFRQQWRTRVDEVAGWSPERWRDAVAYMRFLGDLPALVHLLSDEGAPRWVSADPELARYAFTTPADRRTALATGPLAPVAAAVRASEIDAPTRRDEPLVRTLKRLRAGHGPGRLGARVAHALAGGVERTYCRHGPRHEVDAHAPPAFWFPAGFRCTHGKAVPRGTVGSAHTPRRAATLGAVCLPRAVCA